jgi:hypothetical protein
VAAVFCGGMIFEAAAQINLNANSITFRTYNDPQHETQHYGSLRLNGGIKEKGTGWLQCNRLVVFNEGSGLFSIVLGRFTVLSDFNVSGPKNFIHPHPTDDSKVIRYVATESSEALTLARGTAKTVNGEATIKLPEHFSLVTSGNAPITVIITPEGAPVLLYTKEKSKNQIVVAMKKSDFTEFRDVEFAYQVTGVRDGFENQEVIIDEDKLNEVDSRPKNEVQKRIDAHRERAQARLEKRDGQVKE